jgi:hypothetical protein
MPKVGKNYLREEILSDSTQSCQDSISFQNVEIVQLRANHSRVPRKLSGWGLAQEAIIVGASYWIFGPPRTGAEYFYWMHTNVIYELEEGSNYVQFETASQSIYRVEYFDRVRPGWISDELQNLMINYVFQSRQFLRP